MFNLMLGDCILYFFTFDIKNRQFNFFYLLRLNNVESLCCTDEKIRESQDKYEKHVQDLSKKDLEIEKEKLIYHIQNENSRLDTSTDKINIYTTVILTVSPIVLAIINFKDIVTISSTMLICIVFIIYALLNICIYIYKAVKVSGIQKSAFNELRSSNEKDKCILLQYHFDWQQLRYKAQLFVSFVINIQEWCILMFILIFFVLIGNTYFNNNKEKIDNIKENHIVTTVNIKDIDKQYSFSSIEWQKLRLYIEQKKCKSVIFLINPYEECSYINELNKYEGLSCKIYSDVTINKGTLKIIMEDE